jgi:hypothetical protein
VSEALGRVERPEADSFRGRRKLLVVFLVFSHESAPQEYTERCERYWSQVAEQLAKLAARLGPVRHVYHESVWEGGEAGLTLLEKMSGDSQRVARRLCDDGATLEALEERELAAELSDWERFMLQGFASGKVADLVRDLYSGALKQRNEHAVGVIDATLRDDEVGLLFAREGHGLQFPTSIEVFSVVPPAFDELHRWLRDQSLRPETDEGTEQDVVDAAGSEQEAD